MIVPGPVNLTGYIGSTFDCAVIVYPSADAGFQWVGNWASGLNYSIGNVVIATDGGAYDALKANVSINPIGDLTGTWSTPLSPFNLNGYSGWVEISPIATYEAATPILATPVQIQGTQGQIYIKFTPAQSTTPLINPGTYHHFVALNDTAGNTYYYMNGTFSWVSP